MKKRIACILCALMLCVNLLPAAFAAGPDLSRPCSLTLSYGQSEDGLAGLDISVYRVAEINADGMYQLRGDYAGYPVKIHGITSQTEWQNTASTLVSYIAADALSADAAVKTDEEGKAVFADLKPGLYLVKGVTAEKDREIWTFRHFMVYLPTPVGNTYDYDVEAVPKYSRTPVGENDREYKVTKLWKDSENRENRPVSVTVDLLRDNAVVKTVVLSAENHWSYSWRGTGNWSVVEREIPAGYHVSLGDAGTTFIVTNTWEPDFPPPIDPDEIPEDPDDPPDDPDDPPEDPDDPKDPGDSDVPETGDTSPLWLYIIVMCISGFGLMLLGVGSMRGKKHEKKR